MKNKNKQLLSKCRVVKVTICHFLTSIDAHQVLIKVINYKLSEFLFITRILPNNSVFIRGNLFFVKIVKTVGTKTHMPNTKKKINVNQIIISHL